MVGGGKDREEMSRLIDADNFEKFIKEKYKDGESTDDIKDQMLFDLSYQPTAFDTEKVIEQLEEKQYAYLHDNGDYEEGKYYAFEEAIDIVKKGGVE